MPVAEWKMALDDPGDITAAPGTVPRARALRQKLRELLHDRFRGVQYVLQTLKAFDDEQDFRLLENPEGKPFASAVDFCTASPPYGLGWDERDITALWSETREIALGEFLDQTRQARAQELGGTVTAMAHHGEVEGKMRDQLGQFAQSELSRPYNVRSGDSWGNRADYWAGRLRRDAPAYADALARGEYANVQAACVAAGIKAPPPPQIAMAHAPSKTARAILDKMGCAYVKALMAEMQELLTPASEDEPAETVLPVCHDIQIANHAHGLLPSPVPDFDQEKYFLDEQRCPHFHEYQSTGKTLRYNNKKKACVECVRSKQRARGYGDADRLPGKGICRA